MIREFTLGDIKRVIEIWLSASIKAHGFVAREFWESKSDDMLNIYLPSSETYVFEEGDEINGFISLYGDTIAALFVAPSSQGRGIGAQLVRKAKALRTELNLTVYRENIKSVEFYRKNGFTIRKEQVCAHTGHPELVMDFGPAR